MKTMSSRAQRFANLLAFAAGLTALCLRTTIAETLGPGGPSLPPPVCVVTQSGATIDANSFTLNPDGSTTYNTAGVIWPDNTLKISPSITVYPSGTTVFSDGTVVWL